MSDHQNGRLIAENRGRLIEQHLLGLLLVVCQIDRLDSVSGAEDRHAKVERTDPALRLDGRQLTRTVEAVDIRGDHEDVGAGRHFVERSIHCFAITAGLADPRDRQRDCGLTGRRAGRLMNPHVDLMEVVDAPRRELGCVERGAGGAEGLAEADDAFIVAFGIAARKTDSQSSDVTPFRVSRSPRASAS